ALSGQRVVKETPGTPNTQPSVTMRIPDGSHARRHVVHIGPIRAARHAFVAGVNEPRRCARKYGRLLAGMKGIQPVSRLDKRRRHLVSQSVVQRKPRAKAKLVLRIHRRGPRPAFEIRIASCLAKERGEAEEKVGSRISGILSAERVVAVRIEDVGGLDGIAADLSTKL